MNQKEIDSFDQHTWRLYRTNLYDKIKSLAKRRRFDFLHINKLNSIETKSPIIVSALIYDLIPDQDSLCNLDLQLYHLGKKLVLFTDNIVGKSYFFENIKIFSIPQILGITANYDTIDISTFSKTKLFNCFIQRTDSVRQSWFYFLQQKNLLNRGYVSFLLKQLTDYSELTGKDLFIWIHENYELGNLPHFQNAYQNLIDKVPYRNFVEQENLIPLILDSKYSLNLETYANTDQDCWCFTEKSLRSLQLPTVDLMFLQTNGCAILKELGFEFLDHSEFDSLPWQQRQQRILNILENDLIDYNKDLLAEQAQHNQDLLLRWKKQVMSDNFFDKYFENIDV